MTKGLFKMKKIDQDHFEEMVEKFGEPHNPPKFWWEGVPNRTANILYATGAIADIVETPEIKEDEI